MVSPRMIQMVWERLQRADVSVPAFLNIAGLDDEQVHVLVTCLNQLLASDPRARPVEVLAEDDGIGRTCIEVLREAGFNTLGDLVDRVAWRYAEPPELKELPMWGSTTIGYLRACLVRQGLLQPRS